MKEDEYLKFIKFNSVKSFLSFYLQQMSSEDHQQRHLIQRHYIYINSPTLLLFGLNHLKKRIKHVCECGWAVSATLLSFTFPVLLKIDKKKLGQENKERKKVLGCIDFFLLLRYLSLRKWI